MQTPGDWRLLRGSVEGSYEGELHSDREYGALGNLKEVSYLLLVAEQRSPAPSGLLSVMREVN